MKTDTPPGAAIVTGAGRGLGLGIARGLARAGHPVVLAARSAEELRRAVATLGNDAIHLAGDIGDEAYVERLVEIACERFGTIDVVVNNAGALPAMGPLDELSWEDWHRGIDVDVRGLFNTTRAAIGQLRAQGRGTIITVAAAQGGTISSTLHSAISPSQAALVSLTRCIRAWVEPAGPAVHCLYPQITTAGGVGLAAATAFGAEGGVSADEWIGRRFSAGMLDADTVGAAVVALTHETDGGEWTVGPEGLKAVTARVAPVLAR